MKYRPEIDGLRALAVIPVILFHAGFETFTGGFIGVDVFFVISGYLVTSIILAELEQGKFSIFYFYERRARRIFPVLFLVMLVCLPFAWLLFLPSDMKNFSSSLFAVALFASNILFWRESGYFDTAAELKPLLHTWSIAVEEQFYVIFPIFLILFWKLGKRYILITLGLVFFASLVLSWWATYEKPSASFYLLPTRSWELLIGAFTAFYLSKTNRKEFGISLSELGGWLGLALILFSVYAYSKETSSLGLYPVIPTLGTALIILFATQTTTVGQFFGNKAFVSVGTISYSLYLWHQPLFAYAKYTGVTSFDKGILFSLSVFAIVLAYLSWRFVEVPFRNKSVVGKKAFFIFALIVNIFFATLGLYGYSKNGNLGQYSDEQEAFLEYFRNDLPEWRYFTNNGLLEKYREDCNFYDLSKYRKGNLTNAPIEKISESCFSKKLDASKVVFIWGDSHAQQLYYGLSKILPNDFELLIVASSGCAFNLSAQKNKYNYCDYSNWFAYDRVKDLIPHTIIIGQNLGQDKIRMEEVSLELKRLGVKNIIFTGPSPHWAPSLPVIAARLLPNIPRRTFSGVDKGLIQIDKMLKLSSSNSKIFEYISLIDYFCNDDGCLIHFDTDVSGSITSYDNSHLTPIASYNFAKTKLSPIIFGK